MNGITVTLDELLKLRHAVSQLHLPAHTISNALQQGGFNSSFRGRGMDFVETRVYQPGDDVRAINWAVTARMGKPHTKIYQQERERPVILVVDFSPSMYFGTKISFKSVTAATTATLIAWAALKNGDKVGAFLAKDSLAISKPSRDKQKLVQVLKNLVLYTQPTVAGPVDLVSVCKKLRQIVKSGSLIYFISDFYRLSEPLKNELQQLAKFNEVTNILIYDQLEKLPPHAGDYLFQGPLQGESVLVNTRNKTACTQYTSIFQQRLAQLKKCCYGVGMQLVELGTHQDVFKIVKHMLNRK